MCIHGYRDVADSDWLFHICIDNVAYLGLLNLKVKYIYSMYNTI